MRIHVWGHLKWCVFIKQCTKTCKLIRKIFGTQVFCGVQIEGIPH